MKYVALILSLLVFSRCASVPLDENDPQALLKEAEAEIQNDHYQIAIDKLKAIKNKFSYTSYAVEAQLRIADVYYLQESYIEAAASYELFKDLHPKHPKVPYALFRLAKSYYQDVPAVIARDLGSAQKALDTYRDFMNRFSKSPDVPEAQKDFLELQGRLAEKELAIAEYYDRRGYLRGAKPRYEKLLSLYPESTAAEKAKKRLPIIESKLSE